MSPKTKKTTSKTKSNKSATTKSSVKKSAKPKTVVEKKPVKSVKNKSMDDNDKLVAAITVTKSKSPTVGDNKNKGNNNLGSNNNYSRNNNTRNNHYSQNNHYSYSSNSSYSSNQKNSQTNRNVSKGTKHTNQRVGIFVDVQNMYYSCMNLFKKKVNFGNVLKTAVSDRQLVRAFAYTIAAEMKGERGFHDKLTELGFEVKTKELQTFAGGAKKGDWDVGIAMDILRMAPKLDAVVLVSGDGDFSDLFKYVKALGCRAEVISFQKTTSSRLLAEADDFIDMSLDKRKFLI